MSLADDIITVLLDYHGGYRLMRRRLMGMHEDRRPAAHYNDASIRVTLSRLKHAGFVKNDNGVWATTKKGFEKLALKLPTHTKRKIKEPAKEKSLIIAFDIPERLRRKREWLRFELLNLGFVKLQQSVWLGPAPLPKDFIEALEALDLLRYIKFFKAREAEII
ncbi:MAG: hypothetical protein V1696_03215 [Candidatus Jorgensenbacteria bacterium]